VVASCKRHICAYVPENPWSYFFADYQLISKSEDYIFVMQLSVERLSSMKKYVFGLGSAQVLVTAVVAGILVHFIARQPSPAALIIGNGLALSSTAVVLQVKATTYEQLFG